MRTDKRILVLSDSHGYPLNGLLMKADGNILHADDVNLMDASVLDQLLEYVSNGKAYVENEGISAEVIDIHTIKPIDRELLVKTAKKTGAVITCEEHSVIGGLGGAVCEVLSEACPTPVIRVGIEDTFGRSGKGAELLGAFGLSPENFAAKAKAAIDLKK